MLAASAVLLWGAVGSWRWASADDAARDSAAFGARRAVLLISREVRTRGATGEAEVNGRGWPLTIDPAWFGRFPPMNPLTGRDRPWCEIASEAEHDLLHPARRMAVTEEDAAFWYNPAQGVIRARVGPEVSDQAALDVYNRVNGCDVDNLFDDAAEARRAAAQAEQRRREAARGRERAARPPNADSVVQVRRGGGSE